ncbi:MAG: hypothetical protein JWP61_775 [Friedmanniella sp.]|nr:hypothetical protein [Friedmanniella sp.]
MPFALTVDQIDSRHHGDLVEPTLARLTQVPAVLGFVRTVGDEFQGVLDQVSSVVTVILDLMRSGQWHIGLGIGELEHPLPADSRSARGGAFLAARAAVERAKTDPSHLSVVAARPVDHADEDAEAFLRLVGAVRARRSEPGWAATDLMATGATQAEAAARLGISRQAVGQRLHAAQWGLEQAAVPGLGRLLTRADLAARGPATLAPDRRS